MCIVGNQSVLIEIIRCKTRDRCVRCLIFVVEFGVVVSEERTAAHEAFTGYPEFDRHNGRA